jgi:hypothetical protein
MKSIAVVLTFALLVTGGVALAQPHHAAKGTPQDSAATQAYRAANDKMHKAMDHAYTNDPDVDFIRGMIPHHEGAIDMAKVVLQYGKNEQTKKMGPRHHSRAGARDQRNAGLAQGQQGSVS